MHSTKNTACAHKKAWSVLERATGCHFTGPIALRRGLSPVLPDVSVILHKILYTFFFLMSICTNKFQKMLQKELRKIFQKETKRRKNTFPAALRQPPPGLDNPLKIHYTTNRKGAVSCKRLAPYPRIKEIDRSGWLGVRRSFLSSIFILPLCNFPCDIKSTEQDRKDQAQQADDDRQKCKRFSQCHPTSPLPAKASGGENFQKSLPGASPRSWEQAAHG